MLILLVLGLLLLIAVLGIGSWIDSTLPLSERVLLGIGFWSGCILLIHLVSPIQPLFSMLFSIACAFLFVRSRFFFLPTFLKQTITTIHPIPVGAFLVLLVTSAYSASFPNTWYDSLLYHIPFVQSFIDSAAIEGIALLHIRLSSSSLPFIITTFSQSSHPYLESYTFGTFFFMFTFIALIVWEWKNTILRPKNEYFPLLFLFTSLSLFFFIQRTDLLSTLAQEPTLFVFLVLMVYAVLQSRKTLFFLSFSLGLMTKSSIVFMTPLVVLFSLFWIKEIVQKEKIRQTLIQNQKIIIFSLFPLITWATHSMVLSGCFLFPIPQSCLAVSHGLNPTLLSRYRTTVYEWARFPPHSPRLESDLHWIFEFFIPSIPISLWLIFGISILVLLLNYKQHALLSSLLKQRFVLTLALSTSLLFAFKLAPDIRLIWPFFFVFVAFISSVVSQLISIRFTKLPSSIIIATMLGISLVSVLLSLPKPLRKSQLLYPVETIYNKKAPVQFQDSIPFSFTTPIKGDDRCGVAAFPCVMNPLELSDYRFDVSDEKKLWKVERQE